MQMLPFGEFLDALRDRDFGIGLHEYIAAGKLLERWDSTRRDELRDSLAALLGREADEVTRIRVLFDEFYPPVRSEVSARVQPAAPARRFRLVQLAASRLAWGVAFTLAVLATMGLVVVERLQRDLLPPLPAPPLEAPIAATAFPSPERVIRETSFADALAEPPPVGLAQAPQRRDWRGLAALGAAGLTLVALPLWGRRMRASSRRWTTAAWEGALADLPGPFHGTFVLKDLVTQLPRADIEEAATILGRAGSVSSARHRGGTLDVEASLRATLRAGLQPHLIFRPRGAVQPILVLQDISQGMAIHARRVEGLCRDLGRQGIALERWFFDGDPSQPSARPHGPATRLDTLLRTRDEGPLMLLGNGLGVAASLTATDLGWVAALRRQSRRVWINPISDPKLWPAALQRLPLPAVSMSRAGLLQAARWLTQDDRTAFRQVSRAARVVTRVHVETLQRLASLVPYPTVDLLELLRQRFAPDVPESAVLHTVGRHAASGNLPFRMKDDEIRARAAEMRTQTPALETRVRDYLLTVLGDSEPSLGSAAHLRWQAAVALQQAQLAEVRGEDATRPVETLRALYEGPLWQEVREMVARQPTPVPGASVTRALRTAVSADRLAQAPPVFTESGNSSSLAPFHWSAPGWRVLAVSTAAAVLLALAGAFSSAFIRTSNDRERVYALDYVEAASGPGALAVRRRVIDDDIPNVVQLYRGATPLGGPISLVGTEAVRIAIEADARSAVYQVRADLPSGARALSNTTWAPAPLIVFDARPWARVTMRSSEAGVDAFTQTTPFSIRLPEGTYDLELITDGLAQPVREQRVISANGPRTFTFDMPGFNVDRALEELGVRPPPRSAK